MDKNNWFWIGVSALLMISGMNMIDLSTEPPYDVFNRVGWVFLFGGEISIGLCIIEYGYYRKRNSMLVQDKENWE